MMEHPFPITRYSVIEDIKSDVPLRQRKALETVIQVYWKPVYMYIRMKWNREDESAKDLTQSFFTVALEKEYLTGFDFGKAKFRTYLRVCIDRFVANELKAASRVKRGGKIEIQPFDFQSAESEYLSELNKSTLSPEELFEQEWLRQFFSNAIDSFKQQCISEDKELLFEAFQRYDLHESSTESRPSYMELADALNVSESVITNTLHAARKRFRQILIASLREITASETEFREEAQILFGRFE
ncbi:MAG: hypothetical protein CL946_04830 [Ectothiorhodospiraceae bacterium]|nr:hypothetical protein [Ectothiorhodospiraceae bacterium]